MNEAALSLAIERDIEVSLQAFTGCDEVGEDYRFSRAFEKRMCEIIGETEKPPPKRISVKRRMKLALAIAVIFAAGFMLGAARTPLWNFVINLGSGEISFNAPKDIAPQKKMGLAYTLASVPEGYELSFSELTPKSAAEAYHNSEGGYILFSQQVASSFESYEAAGAEGSYEIDEDDTQYFIYSDGSYTAVKWYSGDYIFSLYSSLDKDTALDLCRKAKLKNNPN